jgi:hypothetical protein
MIRRPLTYPNPFGWIMGFIKIGVFDIGIAVEGLIDG